MPAVFSLFLLLGPFWARGPHKCLYHPHWLDLELPGPHFQKQGLGWLQEAPPLASLNQASSCFWEAREQTACSLQATRSLPRLLKGRER